MRPPSRTHQASLIAFGAPCLPRARAAVRSSVGQFPDDHIRTASIRDPSGNVWGFASTRTPREHPAHLRQRWACTKERSGVTWPRPLHRAMLIGPERIRLLTCSEDCTVQLFANWPQRHSCVEIIARDPLARMCNLVVYFEIGAATA